MNFDGGNFSDEQYSDLDAAYFTNESPDKTVERSIAVFGASAASHFSDKVDIDQSVDRSVGISVFRAQHHHLPSSAPLGQPFVSLPESVKGVDVQIGELSLVKDAPVPIGSLPERPCFLIKTNFSYPLPVTDSKSTQTCIDSIERTLASFSEFDFTSFPGESLWKGKYIQGSVQCEVYIRAYADDSTVIIEANRVRGDAKPFLTFYREFKSKVTGNEDDRKPAPLFMSNLPSKPISDEQFLAGVKPIFEMCECPYLETRAECAKMVCDLAAQEPALLRLSECRTSVVTCLERLINDETDDVKQHAIMALSSFIVNAELSEYKEEVIGNATIMASLLEFAADAPPPVYESIQARRMCAHILYILSGHNAATCVLQLEKVVGSARIHDWADQYTHIRDQRLKEYVGRTRENILKRSTFFSN